METLVDKKDKINIKEFLEDFYELKEQYLFFDCFIISSQHFMNLYQRAQEKQMKNLIILKFITHLITYMIRIKIIKYLNK